MTMALVLFFSAAQAVYAQTASGTLTIGKDQFEIKYAAAAVVKGGTRIVLDLATPASRRVFYLPDPFRIVVDVGTRVRAEASPPGAPRLRPAAIS